MQSAQNTGRQPLAPQVIPFAVVPIALIKIATDHIDLQGKYRCARMNGYNAKKNVNRCYTRGRNPRCCSRRE